jgi:acetyltransferase-like isoleucine patch superfamily enzyme/acyl carrier protein
MARRYAELVLADPGPMSLIWYEFVSLLIPVPGSLGLALRRPLVRKLLGSCGSKPIFGRSLTLRHPDNVHVGNSVVLDDYCLIDARGAGEAGIRMADRVMVNRGASIQAKAGPISIGNDTGIGAYSQIISQGPIEIANNVSIAGGSMIAGGRYEVELSHDSPDRKTRFTGGPIVIEPNVRIGMAAIVLDGVTIGSNSIVAPGSVVYDNVPPDTIVMGNPARPLRKRKSASTEDVLLSQPKPETATRKPARESTALEESVAHQVIREYLEETHYAEFGSGKLGYDDSLFDSGVIDSIGLVGLISMIEEHFGIEFSEDDLVPERLSTVNGLASVVSSKKISYK